MIRTAPPRLTYSGPALFSMGFRPFFLLAGLQAAIVVPLWLAVFRGSLTLPTAYDPIDWHVHEMLFGYTGAVVAGFLFTAVPNWTGRMPARGWQLALLAALWLAGRLAMAGVLGLGPMAVVVLDCAFLLAIADMIGVEIVAGRNWRNLRVLVPVTLLALANIAFHICAAGGFDTGGPIRAGFALVVVLILLIGGRIIPSFTRNWLAARHAPRLPVPMNRFDALCLAAALPGLASWVIWPESWASAVQLFLLAGLHAARLSRWCGLATWRSPLLAMLHLAYGALVLGLVATALAAAGYLSPAAGFHLMGIGGIGGMTVAVMMRAAAGHTGRVLEAGPWLTLAFGLVLAAALVRSLAGGMAFGLDLAAAFWTAAFLIFLWRVGPWLLLPSARRKRPSAPAQEPSARP